MLLGDSGYALKPYCLVPFMAPTTAGQRRYNTAHKRTRCSVERSIGIWKRRFHVLHVEVRLAPAKCCKIIVACAVLQNLAIAFKEPEPEFADIPVIEEEEGRDLGRENLAGRVVRDSYVEQFFQD